MKLEPADIEAIAQRVAELFDQRPTSSRAVRYLDAGQLAEVLGVERDWVYAHAHTLGAIRLGGPRGRLRFDLEHVTRSLTPTVSAADRQASSPRCRPTSPEGVELIPYAS